VPWAVIEYGTERNITGEKKEVLFQIFCTDIVDKFFYRHDKISLNKKIEWIPPADLSRGDNSLKILLKRQFVKSK
jgi:hypothetical protein